MPQNDDPLQDETLEEEPLVGAGPEEARPVPHDDLVAHLQGEAPAPEFVAELDTVLEEVPEERGLPSEEPDLTLHVPGMIPVYNASAYAFELPYAGSLYTVRAGGHDLVPEGAADLAVGVDNCGGRYSKFGLRRLYGPESRFKDDARKAGVTLQAWVNARNRSLRDEAATAAAAYDGEIPSIQGFAGLIPPPQD